MVARRIKRVLAWSAGVLAALAIAVLALGWALDRPLPEGQRGTAAKTLAKRLQRAVRIEAWQRTGAVRWTFAGKHELLWDRDRGRVRVRWDDCEVLLRTADRSGQARCKGQQLTGKARDKRLEQAYRYWVNDAFWLNPMDTLFDPGTVRKHVTLSSGRSALLVTYTKGGVTPGDSYLWIPDRSGLPKAWRMWVSILPIGGLEVTWEGWKTLSTGARIATEHAWGPLTIELTDVRGAGNLEALTGGKTPFAALDE
jgi:hypothetical protein